MAGKYYLGEEDRSALSEMIAAFRKDPTYYTTPNFINQDDTDNFNSECLIALTPEGGITPLDGVTVGFADCEVYRAVQTTTIGELDLVFCQYSVRVYNLNTEAVAGDTYVPIHKDKAGFWWTTLSGVAPSSNFTITDGLATLDNPTSIIIDAPDNAVGISIAGTEATIVFFEASDDNAGLVALGDQILGTGKKYVEALYVDADNGVVFVNSVGFGGAVYFSCIFDEINLTQRCFVETAEHIISGTFVRITPQDNSELGEGAYSTTTQIYVYEESITIAAGSYDTTGSVSIGTAAFIVSSNQTQINSENIYFTPSVSGKVYLNLDELPSTTTSAWGSVTVSKGFVTSGAVAVPDGSVSTASVVDDAITEDQIADDAISEDQLQDDCISNAQLQDDCVDADNCGFTEIDGGTF